MGGPQDGKMWYMTAVWVKIHFFLIVPSAGPLGTVSKAKTQFLMGGFLQPPPPLLAPIGERFKQVAGRD